MNFRSLDLKALSKYLPFATQGINNKKSWKYLRPITLSESAINMIQDINQDVKTLGMVFQNALHDVICK